MMSTGRPSALSVMGVPLAPRWATVVALAAFVTGSFLAALVWHATRLDPVDAWVLRWQELAFTQAGRLAAIVSATLEPVVLLTIVACTVIGWWARRRDLILLALLALPATSPHPGGPAGWRRFGGFGSDGMKDPGRNVSIGCMNRL